MTRLGIIWLAGCLCLGGCLVGWSGRGFYEAKYGKGNEVKFAQKMNHQCVEAMRNMEIKYSQDVQACKKEIADREEYHAALSKANAELVSQRDVLKKDNNEIWDQRNYFVKLASETQHPLKNPLDSNCLSNLYNLDGSVSLARPRGQAFADQCEDHSGD